MAKKKRLRETAFTWKKVNLFDFTKNFKEIRIFLISRRKILKIFWNNWKGLIILKKLK